MSDRVGRQKRTFADAGSDGRREPAVLIDDGPRPAAQQRDRVDDLFEDDVAPTLGELVGVEGADPTAPPARLSLVAVFSCGLPAQTRRSADQSLEALLGRDVEQLGAEEHMQVGHGEHVPVPQQRD